MMHATYTSFPLILALAALLPAWSPSSQEAGIPARQKQVEFDESTLDEEICRGAKVGADGPSLLKYLRDRTLTDPDPERLAKLIQQLGDPKYADREKAFKALLDLGPAALDALQGAADHPPDLEVSQRISELRRRIGDGADTPVLAAVARLISQRKPEDAAASLLAFMPFVASDAAIEEICKALAVVAIRDGKVDAAVRSALTDMLPLRRAAAGAALASAGVREHFAAARGLLDDSDASVRLRVARAFVQCACDKDAVQVLIDCLRHLPVSKAALAEDLLLIIAGDQAPKIALGIDDSSREKSWQEWNKWWKSASMGVDLAKVDFGNNLNGFTLAVWHDPVNPDSQPICFWAAELDPCKQIRWKFKLPEVFVAAEVIGFDRVLVAEATSRVTHRDFKGNVKWDLRVPGMIRSAQHLPNRNTFVVTTGLLAEYSPTQKVVWASTPDAGTIQFGRKMRDGNVVFITSIGDVVLVTSEFEYGSTLFNVGAVGNAFIAANATLEEVGNDHLLVSVKRQNRVAEHDRDGKLIWSIEVQKPIGATRLPNGNTLVAQENGRITEYNRFHRVVWHHQLDGPVYVARKR